MGEQKEKTEPTEGALFALEDDVANTDDPHEDDADDRAEYAADVLQAILDHMNLDVDVEIREDTEEENEIVLDVDGPDAGRAIGKRGLTLDALQFLVNKIVGRMPGPRVHVIVDSADYRERYDKTLVTMAKREAKRARKQGRVVSLKPMSARDRRVVHLSLAKLDGVSTVSEGEGSGRHIRLIPSGEVPADGYGQDDDDFEGEEMLDEAFGVSEDDALPGPFAD